MKIEEKIKGFTLSEMLVVLLITVIVVGMGFAALQMVQKQMWAISGNYQRNTEFNLVRQGLWVDFNTYDGAWFDKKTSELLFSNGFNEVRYQMSKEYIVRNRDTFNIEVAEIAFFFLGNPQESGEIDAIELMLPKSKGGAGSFVFKNNAGTTFINN